MMRMCGMIRCVVVYHYYDVIIPHLRYDKEQLITDYCTTPQSYDELDISYRRYSFDYQCQSNMYCEYVSCVHSTIITLNNIDD